MLGVWFTQDEKEMNHLKLNERLEKMKIIINFWTCRGLTVFGRVMILKTLVLSQIINICSVIYAPESFINHADDIFLEFLWGKIKDTR